MVGGDKVGGGATWVQECALSTLPNLQFLQGFIFFILLLLKFHLQARHEIAHLDEYSTQSGNRARHGNLRISETVCYIKR